MLYTSWGKYEKREIKYKIRYESEGFRWGNKLLTNHNILKSWQVPVKLQNPGKKHYILINCLI